MRKLKLQMQVSLDGFVAGPNGEMDWMAWNREPAITEYVSELTASAGHILLGRRLAEGFIPAWETAMANPETADTFASQMVNIPKLVCSKTLQSSPWNNATLMKGDVAAEINALKQQPDGDIMVYGGAALVRSLIGHNLVDDYHLFVNPAAIGSGLSIFPAGAYQKLKLIKSTAFACGMLALHYQPAY